MTRVSQQGNVNRFCNVDGKAKVTVRRMRRVMRMRRVRRVRRVMRMRAMRMKRMRVMRRILGLFPSLLGTCCYLWMGVSVAEQERHLLA